MKNKGAVAILTSFVTLKVLNDTKKYNSSYQILSEFIKYIISTESLYNFSAVKMKNLLNGVFGFNIPEVVIKTTLKNIPFVERADNMYRVNMPNVLCDSAFLETKQNAESNNLSIINLLSEYIISKQPDKEIDEHKLTKDFIAFLLDDQQNNSGDYIDIIGEFILKHENDENLQESLRAIAEGSIIYIGLNNNIGETGSITKKLTLYLGTEVLFSLAGFNGEIYKQLAEDFFCQVKIANSNGIKISLKYFSEIKDEIDSFFYSAAMIVDGQSQSCDTVAMTAILNNCKESSDVIIKQSDFYHKLKSAYGIVLDDYKDYYSPYNEKYNLESMQYTEAQQQNAWRFVSHINKLRQGKTYANYTDVEYLFITNTKITINASKEQVEIEKRKKKKNTDMDIVGYAVSLSKITNLLWVKLGGCFGKYDYPTNINSVLRARVVLAASLTYNVSEMYNKLKEDHSKGLITEEQLAARIIALREKTLLPEELEGDSIEDIMDFSAEYISRFEEEYKKNKRALYEKEKTIKNLNENHNVILQAKEKELNEINKIVEEERNKNKELTDRLTLFEEKENRNKEKRKKRKNILFFILKLIARLVAIIIITVLAVAFFKTESNTPAIICTVLDIIAIFSAIYTVVKKDIAKYL